MQASKLKALVATITISIIAALAATGCTSSPRQAASGSATAVTAMSTPSPPPTTRPVLDAQTRFGTVHTAALPASNEQPDRWLQQLIPDAHQFMVSEPGGYLPCEHEGCQFPPADPQKPGRIALWDFETGAIEPIHTLRVGAQLPATASDGRFLAWVEGCDHGFGGAWDLYAMDLSTGESWHVDSDFGSAVGDPGLDANCPSSITITAGRLIYSVAVAYVVNLAGHSVSEVRSYDLATRTRSPLPLADEYPAASIGCGACGTIELGLVSGFFSPVYADNGQVFWTGSGDTVCAANNSCTTPNALYVTDTSNGNTGLLSPDLGQVGLLRLLTGGSQGRNEGAGKWEGYIQVVSDFVLWVDLPENIAMAYDVISHGLIKLSDCSANLVAADDQALYWTCGNDLHWVELAQR